MTLIELYQSQATDGGTGENARALLKQTHWFTDNADFDPKTAEALPQVLSAFLYRVTRSGNPAPLHDRLWRITEHARPSVERLFRALNESPRREHALLPVRAVRELDANSFIKLSNRPGRNIREKLAGKPYLQAVRRFQSVNLPENRLLKTFVTRLAELLELRQNCLDGEEDELLPKIQSWLLSEEAQTIARWENLPPNNTLLSHRDYRRVWDAWSRMQTLDEDIARDYSQLEVRDKTMRLWNEYARMYSEGTHYFAEMPVLFDYEKFKIQPWISQLSFKKAIRKIIRSSRMKEISDPVCVDLAILYPHYATTTKSSLSLYDSYLWQEWEKEDESVDIELFNSDAAYLHPDATSISSRDLFFSKDNSLEHLDRAARAFASKLRETFKNDTFIWLVPDFLNDFELEIIRRNINARFPNAEPLPCSVAAVFEQVDYSKIKNDGYPIVVVDTIGGKTCATKLIARINPELKKLLPETNGFFWERCPPVIISHRENEEAEGGKWQNCDIITVDDKGQWCDRIRTEKPQFIDPSTLKRDPRIGQFAFCINVTKSPVGGGIRLHALQQRAGNIPLWRDQIPELYILLQRFCLVGKNISVEPIRGLSVPIPIHDNFYLKPGKRFYRFPLYQGEKADEIGYSARLDSPAFPRKTVTVCKLNLTFEYGADEPYKLIFDPLDKSFPSIHAIWRRTEEDIITDAPAPEYPTPMSWTELRNAPKPDSKETSDLLEWVLSAIDGLDRDLFIRPQKRIVGKICRYWGMDKGGKHFTIAKCDETDADVFIHETALMKGLHYEDYEEGNEVSFELREYKGKFSGYKVANSDYREETQLRNFNDNVTTNVVKIIRQRLYVPFIQVWRDGRSIMDEECPKDFANEAKYRIKYLTDLLSQPGIPQPVKNEFLFLLACLHKDTTDECVQWLTDQVENGDLLDLRAIGFALGDVSEEWQQYIFSKLATNPSNSAISVFAYAIWREQRFVERFSISELQEALYALSRRLANIQAQQKEDGTFSVAVKPFELLYGLMRTRTSTDTEIKMLLQPQQKITKMLEKQVKRVIEIVAQNKIELASRIQLMDLPPKPTGDRTPDLLYALRLSLSGDDGAIGIRTTGVSNNDND